MTDIDRKRALSRERNRRWRERNPERAREVSRENVARWRSENQERSRADCRAYHAANREQILERKRAYYQRIRKSQDATPEGRLKDLNRKHRRRAACGSGNVTQNEWEAILAAHDSACAYCGSPDRPLEMDHVIALSKGGKHCASNIVPACKPCNSSKGAR